MEGRFKVEWGCTRVKGHKGECMTVGIPVGLRLKNGCCKYGARFLGNDEPRPADLYEHGKEKPKVKMQEYVWGKGWEDKA